MAAITPEYQSHLHTHQQQWQQIFNPIANLKMSELSELDPTPLASLQLPAAQIKSAFCPSSQPLVHAPLCQTGPT